MSEQTTPWQKYQADLERDDFQHDLAQENAVKHLQSLYEDLTSVQPQKKGLLSSLFGSKKTKSIQGLYFWGGVGRGKTYLVDTFYECLPTDKTPLLFKPDMYLIDLLVTLNLFSPKDLAPIIGFFGFVFTSLTGAKFK